MERETPCLADVAAAVWNDRRLRMVHRRPGGTGRTSEVEPLGLVHKTGTWYLVAMRGGDPVVFRADRITAAEVLDVPAHRPEGFSLQRFWRDWEDAYARTLPRFVADVRLGPRAQHFRARLGPLAPRAVEEDVAGADGWTRQRLTFDDAEVATAALLALAPDVEVLAPVELVRSVAQTARAVAERHGGGGVPGVRRGGRGG